MRNTQNELNAIAHAVRVYGIHATLGQAAGFLPRDGENGLGMAMDHALALDALPALVTLSNSGVPAFLTNYVDPKLIEVLTAKMAATEIFGEVKKGDWTTLTAYFSMVEVTGETSSYGDYNENGEVGTNVNWPQRQSYVYQTMTQWGDRQLAMMGNAQIDWAGRQNIASGEIMAQFQNKSYFYGVSGLQNYGILNDPNLPAAITPITKAAGGFTWIGAGGAANATYLEVINDIAKMFADLQTRSGGHVNLTTPMKLCMSTTSQVAMTFVATLGTGVSVWDTLKKTYPNLTLHVAVQYATQAGQLVQLICDSVQGQQTAQTAFSEKMRAHGVVRGTSSFKEKKSAGTWGTIYFIYSGISQMLGV